MTNSRRIALFLAALIVTRCEQNPNAHLAAIIDPKVPPVLSSAAFNICWDSIEAPKQMRPGERVELVVTIRNCSPEIWPDPQMGDPVNMTGSHAVRIATRWRGANGPASGKWSREELPWPLLPGKSVEVGVRVTAPSQPGRYLLDLDLLQEAVAWFGEQTGKRPSIAIDVE